MSKVIRCDQDGCRHAIPLPEAGPEPNTYTLPDCGGVHAGWVALNPPGVTDGGPDFCSLECAAEWIKGTLDAFRPVKDVA